jgi:YVTN family beta-propeller protein
MAVAVNETTNRAYVVGHNSSSVTVIDGKSRTVVATIKTGAGPEAVAVNPVTNRVYTGELRRELGVGDRWRDEYSDCHGKNRQ